MGPQRRSAEEWPTILWIAWRAGDTEHLEPLCRQHREHVFEQYPATAHGEGRRGEACSRCRDQPGSTR
jgi:hypothetical protein